MSKKNKLYKYKQIIEALLNGSLHVSKVLDDMDKLLKTNHRDWSVIGFIIFHLFTKTQREMLKGIYHQKDLDTQAEIPNQIGKDVVVKCAGLLKQDCILSATVDSWYTLGERLEQIGFNFEGRRFKRFNTQTVDLEGSIGYVKHRTRVVN